MTQTLWDRCTLCLCQEPTSCISSWRKTTFSSLCGAYTTRSLTGSIFGFEWAWTSYTCFRDFAPFGPPVILDTTLKACDGGFSFSWSLIACKVLFAVGRRECWYSSSYFRVTGLGNGLLPLRRKCGIATKPPHHQFHHKHSGIRNLTSQDRDTSCVLSSELSCDTCYHRLIPPSFWKWSLP